MIFLWILGITLLVFIGTGVGLTTFGHLLGMHTHRWYVRQVSARKVVDPKKQIRCTEQLEDRWGNFSDCGTRADTPCGKCWDHCDTCVRTEAKKPERQNRALEIEMGLDRD